MKVNGWIVVKEHVWNHEGGNSPTLAYLWPSEFNRKVFSSNEEAYQFIKENGFPLGWVSMEIELSVPEVSTDSAAIDAERVELSPRDVDVLTVPSDALAPLKPTPSVIAPDDEDRRTIRNNRWVSIDNIIGFETIETVFEKQPEQRMKWEETIASLLNDFAHACVFGQTENRIRAGAAIERAFTSRPNLGAAPERVEPAPDKIAYPRDIFQALIDGNSPYAFYLFQWVPYQTDAKRWRLKMLHDVKAFDGREAHGIWPNGASCGPFRDDEVEFIRISRKQWGAEWKDPRPEPPTTQKT